MVQILSLVIAQRTRIILETDRQEDDPGVSDDNEDPPIHLLEQASADALQKITDYSENRNANQGEYID